MAHAFKIGQQKTLTEREADVAYWNALGKTNAEIAQILGIGPATVKTHLEHVCDKLGVYNRTAAVTESFRRGILKFTCILLSLFAQAALELDGDAMRARPNRIRVTRVVRITRPGRSGRRETFTVFEEVHAA